MFALTGFILRRWRSLEWETRIFHAVPIVKDSGQEWKLSADLLPFLFKGLNIKSY
jgi:hypothetical protein